MTTHLTVRVLISNDEMLLVQGLEKDVWGMEPIPTHQTYTAAKNGGLVIGAFDGEKLVGFSYGFPGFLNKKTFLCSHMLGILPTYQLMGIGKLLKEEQLKLAKEMGYDLITWTFDPLETRNAYLNVTKLYGIVDIYLENCYGEMNDGINKGLPTDRLQITWWINSKRVDSKWMPDLTTFVQPFYISLSKKGNPLLQEPTVFNPTAEGYEVPIPHQIQSIKSSEPELALKWRMQTRSIFQKLFKAGYALVNVRKTEENYHFYQFVKKSTIPLSEKE
jgi:predicted GNAT superfamily acetyltransferase